MPEPTEPSELYDVERVKAELRQAVEQETVARLALAALTALRDAALDRGDVEAVLTLDGNLTVMRIRHASALELMAVWQECLRSLEVVARAALDNELAHLAPHVSRDLDAARQDYRQTHTPQAEAALRRAGKTALDLQQLQEQAKASAKHLKPPDEHG